MTAPSVRFRLNGHDVDTGPVDPHTTLSKWLRLRGQTGTKEGCAEGDCGACTVLLSDVDGQGAPAWRSVTSCITFVPMLHGREVRTVEGIAHDDGSLHAVQAAMVLHGGSQCGYCTPGFICSMVEGYARADLDATAHDKLHDQIHDQLNGNLCRCTGYRPIRDAMVHALRVRDAGGAAPDADLVTIGCKRTTTHQPDQALCQSSAAVDVNACGARFVRPTSLAALLALRAEHPEGSGARLVAGATEIGVEVRKKSARVPLLISTEGVAELRVVTARNDAWVVGGAATLTAFEDVLAADDSAAARALKKMLRVFASRQIRNRATLAGNLVTASPIGDMAPVLLALDATVVVASAARGEREIDLGAFFVAYRKTALAADEVLVRVVIKKPPATTRIESHKVSKRKELDISIVAACFRVDVDEHGKVAAARLAYGGVAATPVRAKAAEAALVGCVVQRDGALFDDATLAAVAEQLSALSPISDVRAGAAFRRALIPSLFEKFARNVQSEAQGAAPGFEAAAVWRAADASHALLHESAVGHVTGAARYVDDTAHQRVMLDLWPVWVPHAHARIDAIDTQKALAMPGVVAVFTAKDIPGENDVGAIRKDETLLASGEVKFRGHPVAVVVAHSVEAARAAAAAVRVDCTPLPAILGIEQAIAQDSFHTAPHVIRRGDVDGAFQSAAHVLEGTLSIGGQEHFYLETHAAFAERGDDDDVHVQSSTQHPSEVQAAVSHVLHIARNRVVVTSPRMGGGFGGKETQGNTWAALAALSAWHLHKPVRVQLDRDVDMELTGKRHPFLVTYRAAADAAGRLTALEATLVSDGGWALDLSESINDRALFHIDNAYFLENVALKGRVAKTHVVSHTAFRGFGGPQGVLVIEDVLGRLALKLQKPAEEIRALNLYRPGEGQSTPYGQVVDDVRGPRIWQALRASAEVSARRKQLEAWNKASPHVKRALSMTPVKFGISFTASFLNQAGALVVVYRDGTVQVNHGGTEMGQGLYAKVQGVVMRELGLPRAAVRVMKTQTDKVPNTSATAASSGADLNGAAAQLACVTLKERLAPVAAVLLEHKLGRAVHPTDVVFASGVVRANTQSPVAIPFADVVEAAYLRQIQLSATGFYRTPDLLYDRARGQGKPFHYFAWGAAVAEVELDGLTGMKRVRRVDILHDVGDSLNPGIDRGQIEGGFVQGQGWLTAEELKWHDDGRLLTHSASTYQIPSIGDAPGVFRVALLDDAAQADVIHGSKAVGEPPLMLALSVREALREAVAAFGAPGQDVTLPSPLTHEVLLAAVQRARATRG